MTDDADPPFLYLTTSGRRSGNPHTIEIWFARSPGTPSTLYLMAGGRTASDWVRNLVARPEASVRIGTRDAAERAVVARVVDAGTDEDALARRLLVEKYESPGKNDLDEWGRTALPVALELSG